MLQASRGVLTLAKPGCLARAVARAPASRRAVAVMASAAPSFEIAVKGAGDVLGDCPFCHRALLTLEEKHVPYVKTLIDFDAKPEWLLEVNEKGAVPVMRDLATGEWIVDSGTIVDYLEAQFPEPALGTTETASQVGMDVFPAFVQLLKAAPEEAAAKEEALLGALRKLNEHLAAGGPFIAGEKVSAADCAVMPRLYHATEALKHFKGWELPAEFSAVASYMQTFTQRDSWKNTYYSPELVVKGWQKHVGGQ